MEGILVSPDFWHYVPAWNKVKRLKTGTSDLSLKMYFIINFVTTSEIKDVRTHCCHWFFNTHFIDHNSGWVIKQMTTSAKQENVTQLLYKFMINTEVKLTSKERMQCLRLKCENNLLSRTLQVRALVSPRNARQWILGLETGVTWIS
jgi:hypothetical protein